MKIKADGITNLTDARYFAAKEVAYLTFHFTEGAADYINPSIAKAIAAWVEGVSIVGKWTRLSVSEINEWANLLSLNIVQIDDFLMSIHTEPLQVPVIKRFVVKTTTDLATLRAEMLHLKPIVLAFELDFENIDWNDLKQKRTLISLDDLKQLAHDFKIIFKINVQSTDIESFKFKIKPYALTLSGGEEEQVGVKSFDELDAIFDILES
jgi:phosphoribosylanthranilate isomerase